MLKPFLLWIALAGLYLLLAGTISATEIGSAVLCAGLGLVWALRASRVERLHLSFAAYCLWVLIKAFAGVPRQMVEVGLELLQAALWGGERSAIRHRTLGELAPGSAPFKGADHPGLTATGVLAASLAPRTFVLHADHSRDRVLEHDFAPSAGEST
jgi:hypothetical protein